MTSVFELATCSLLLLLHCSAAADCEQTEPAPSLAVPYYPTPHDVVDKMLEVAALNRSDVVYDLGCGDGRIVIAAARKHSCRSVGYELDARLVKEAKQNVEKSGMGELVEIRQQDIFDLDLSEADVVTLYLAPHVNTRLLPQLERLRPGTRIVSHEFDIRGVIPDKVVYFDSTETGLEHTIYLWTVPLKKVDVDRAQSRTNSPP